LSRIIANGILAAIHQAEFNQDRSPGFSSILIIVLAEPVSFVAAALLCSIARDNLMRIISRLSGNSSMRVTTSIVQHTLQAAAESARLAEAAGYDGVATMENTHDPFLPLAVAAVATQKVELATSIALAFPRSPMVVANAVHDLNVSSGGRVVLGLGTQVKGHNERRFSVPWSAPAPRLQEYIEALHAIWRCWEQGEPLNYSGEHYRFTLMPPNFKPPASGLPRIPVTIAAVGSAMLRLAGRLCDGVRLHPFCTRRYLETIVIPQLTEGFKQTAQVREHFEISGGGFIATGPDEETVAHMLEFIRYRVAFYGSTRTYHPVFEQHGLEDLGIKLHQMSKAGRWEQMAGEVSDDVVRLFAAVGTYDVIVGEIEKHYGTLTDTIAETLLPGSRPALPADLIQDIQRIATPFQGFASGW
jgi:probable F420-dependent oxidoreductase